MMQQMAQSSLINQANKAAEAEGEDTAPLPTDFDFKKCCSSHK